MDFINLLEFPRFFIEMLRPHYGLTPKRKEDAIIGGSTGITDVPDCTSPNTGSGSREK
jgi:hypothetical protein